MSGKTSFQICVLYDFVSIIGLEVHLLQIQVYDFVSIIGLEVHLLQIQVYC
jgi:hypothetical protein